MARVPLQRQCTRTSRKPILVRQHCARCNSSLHENVATQATRPLYPHVLVSTRRLVKQELYVRSYEVVQTRLKLHLRSSKGAL